MKTATHILTLATVRDPSITCEQLATLAGRSDYFAAGLIDAVEGNAYFADGTIDWCEASDANRNDYLDGHAAGQAMLDAEREADDAASYADACAEMFALATAETAHAAELVPLAADDTPW